MFSKMMAGLRLEAEKVSESNLGMWNKLQMAQDNPRGFSWNVHEKISGQDLKNKVQYAGVGLGVGGVMGIMGVASANVAAASVAAGVSAGAVTTTLASISTALATLGTVAVGTAVLPAATVAVIGAGVAGIAVMGVSKLMGVNSEKAYDVTNALQRNDQNALRQIASENIGVADWLKGAKNLVVKSLREAVMGVDNSLVKSASPLGMNPSGVGSAPPLGVGANSIPGSSKAAGVDGHAFREYDAQGLFPGGEMAQAKMVDAISRAAWEKHGVVVSDDRIHECLGQSQRDASFSGKILAVNEKSGLVLQSTGRGQATIHNLKDFQKMPVVGQNMDVAYKGGQMQGAKEQGQQQGAGVGR